MEIFPFAKLICLAIMSKIVCDLMYEMYIYINVFEIMYDSMYVCIRDVSTVPGHYLLVKWDNFH